VYSFKLISQFLGNILCHSFIASIHHLMYTETDSVTAVFQQFTSL